jgi:hypothetical protein
VTSFAFVAVVRAGGWSPFGVAVAGPFRVPALILSAVLVGTLGVVYYLLREQGPTPVLVLLGRYTIFPFLLLALVPVLLAGLWLAPAPTFLALTGALWVVLIVAVAAGWSLGTVVRAVKRVRLRASWPSVARSAGLAVRHDRRSPRWPGGVTSSTLGAEVIEHLPRIWRGRCLPGHVGVVYRLRPAKGATVGEVSKAAPALAAGLGVRRVTVETDRPNRGRLICFYRDPLTTSGGAR